MTAGAVCTALPAVGSVAPDFTLDDQHGSPVTLSSFRGRRVVLLVFYPYSFTGVCTSELKALRKHIGWFQNDRVQVLGVSCDSAYVQRAFAEQERLTFPVLSDHWPHGAVAQAYGVFDAGIGAARRGTFVIDTEGVVRWRVVNAIPDRRDVDAYRAALAEVTGA